jgi:hypothetical protein
MLICHYTMRGKDEIYATILRIFCFFPQSFINKKYDLQRKFKLTENGVEANEGERK